MHVDVGGSSNVLQSNKLIISFISTSSLFIVTAEAPKPDVSVSETRSYTHQSAGEPASPKANIPAISSQAIKPAIDRISMFKPTLDVAEKKESRNSKTSERRRQKHDEVVFKKRELAERQAAEAAAHERQAAKAAAHESQQDATAEAQIVPDAAMSNDDAADADLNNRIDEIENEMQQTYDDFQNL
jgi:hypothetical protein